MRKTEYVFKSIIDSDKAATVQQLIVILQAAEPVRKLNLRDATEVKIDHSKGKQNCIR